MTAREPLSPDQIKEFVTAGHFDLTTVKTMLAETPALLNSVHYWTEDQPETALAAASHVGNRAIAEFLLERGAPMTICTAAMLGLTEHVREFLEDDPALANARGAHHIPILFHAALSGETDLTRLLLAEGNNREGIDDALHAAAGYGHLDMVRWLLANGASDINVKDWQGKTPLAVALENEDDDMATLLRSHGASE